MYVLVMCPVWNVLLGCAPVVQDGMGRAKALHTIKRAEALHTRNVMPALRSKGTPVVGFKPAPTCPLSQGSR